MVKIACLVLVAVVTLANEVIGHGMMLDPPNRGSAWRYLPGFPVNYNDNANFCGGNSIQNGLNGGKCGLCGDDWRDPQPRKNENSGQYGTGQVVATYRSGQVIDTYTLLTANHLGIFQYSICKILDSSKPEPGEECFFPLSHENGAIQASITKTDFEVRHRLKLPNGFTCKHCVLRWHYKTGNSWGQCEDGTSGLGCGPQETFRTCTDISII